MSVVNEDIFTLRAFKELSVNVSNLSETVSVELLDGNAEIFGVEMVKNIVRTFTSSFAVLTNSGCTLKLVGSPSRTKTQSINPIIHDIHMDLQNSRKRAFNRGETGPIVLVTGPTDVGKSTLVRSLSNYAVRCNMNPLLIDLDVGQSSISIPGTLGILPLDCPGDVVKGYCDQKLSVYFFGHKSPGENMLLYFLLISKLSSTMYTRFKDFPSISSSGAIIDTCGWVSGGGYSAILHAVKSFQVSTVFVVDDRKLHYSLSRDLPDCVETKFINQLDGVVVRNKKFRINRRDELIRQYFYGKDILLTPHLIEIKYLDFEIVRICCYNNKIQSFMYDEPRGYLSIQKVPIEDLSVNQILAISYAKTVDEVMVTSVLGFLCVKEIDGENMVLKVMSPKAAPLPNNILITGDIIYGGQKMC